MVDLRRRNKIGAVIGFSLMCLSAPGVSAALPQQPSPALRVSELLPTKDISPLQLGKETETSAKSAAKTSARSAPKSHSKVRTSGHIASASRANVESYKDLIEKARNLTLQRDRLQASQVLQRGLQREPKNSQGYREIGKTLDDLTDLFYTEKGQTLFAQADGLMENKPREALETLQAALRIEDVNLMILRSLARVYLILGDCDHANAVVVQADGLNPVNAEVRLLRMQVADCQKNTDKFAELDAMTDVDLGVVDKYVRSLQIKDLWRRKEHKKARALLSTWEQSAGEYPEVLYWRWKLSLDQPFPDRAAALAYIQLCQNLSPRQKKTHGLDLELCAGREKVEEFLKTSSLQEQTTNSAE